MPHLAGHQEAELADGDAGGRHGLAQPAAVHHGDAVRQAHQLVEVLRDQHDPGPAPPGVEQAAVHERHRADVEPAGRLVGEQQHGSSSSTRPSSSFCMLPPESRPTRWSGPSQRTS